MNPASDRIQFTVWGTPVPKQRARAGKGGRHYTPKATRDYERLVRERAEIARNIAAGEWWSLRARYAVRINITLPDHRRRDIDNVAKAILDACNGVLWEDDSQIDELRIVRLPPHRANTRVNVLVVNMGEDIRLTEAAVRRPRAQAKVGGNRTSVKRRLTVARRKVEVA